MIDGNLHALAAHLAEGDAWYARQEPCPICDKTGCDCEGTWLPLLAALIEQVTVSVPSNAGSVARRPKVIDSPRTCSIVAIAVLISCALCIRLSDYVCTVSDKVANG